MRLIGAMLEAIAGAAKAPPLALKEMVATIILLSLPPVVGLVDLVQRRVRRSKLTGTG